MLGHHMPDIEQDLDGYVDWVSGYMQVRSILEVNLGNMLAVVVSDSRYTALGRYGRTLELCDVIEVVLNEYSQVGPSPARS